VENFRENHFNIFLFSEAKGAICRRICKKTRLYLYIFLQANVMNIWKNGKTEFSTMCGKLFGKLFAQWGKTLDAL